jgi:phosphoglycolate phosphatase
MTPPYTHIVWDWNGTLLDDAWLCVEIMDGLLRRRGLPGLTPSRYAELFDFPVRAYYERLGFDFDAEPFERPALEFVDAYESRRGELALRPGARAVLEALGAAGCRQHLLSAYPHHTLLTLVAAHDLSACFERLMGIEDPYAASKLHRGVELARHTRDGRTLVVGDTRHDADVAAAMGADCVLLPAGHQSRERLAACGVPLINDLADLPALAGVENPRDGRA